MSRDRTRTRDRERSDHELDVEFEIGADEGAPAEIEGEGERGGLRERTSKRAKRIFSPRLFVAALLVVSAGLFAASTVIPLPGAGLLGVFVATFLFGLVVDERRYVETALAGGTAAAASTLLDFAVVAFLGGFGISLALLAGGLGAVVGAVGTYFGRDLRDGLTRGI